MNVCDDMKLDLCYLAKDERQIQNFEHKQKISPHEVCLDYQPPSFAVKLCISLVNTISIMINVIS